MVLFESNDDYYPGYTIVYYGENPIAVQDNITYSFFYQPEETAGLKVYEYKYGKKAWIGVFDRDSKFKPELLNVCYRKEESEDSLVICFELPIMKRSSKECIEEAFHINPLW